MSKYFEKEALSTGAKWGLGLGAAAVLAPAAAVAGYAAHTGAAGYVAGRVGLPKAPAYAGGPFMVGGYNAGEKKRKKKQAKQMAKAETTARKQIVKEYGQPKLAANFKELGKALGVGTGLAIGATALTGAALVGIGQYQSGKALGRLGAPGATKYFNGLPGIMGYNSGAKKRRVAKAKKSILAAEYGIK